MRPPEALRTMRRVSPSATERPSLASAMEKQREVSREAGAHQETESLRLLGLLRETEEAIRRIAALELQILGQEELRGRLQAESLALSARKIEVDGTVSGLARERDRLQEDLAAAEQAKALLETEARDRLQAIKRLVRENDDLQREVEKLQSRRARMEESVEALRRARDEYQAKIESLKSHHDALLK